MWFSRQWTKSGKTPGNPLRLKNNRTQRIDEIGSVWNPLPTVFLFHRVVVSIARFSSIFNLQSLIYNLNEYKFLGTTMML